MNQDIELDPAVGEGVKMNHRLLPQVAQPPDVANPMREHLALFFKIDENQKWKEASLCVPTSFSVPFTLSQPFSVETDYESD